MLHVPLLADGIWGWIVPILVVLFYVISHIWNAIQGPQPQQQRPGGQRRPRGPQGERPLPDQPQPAGQSQLNTEIEQFLKRANERRAEKSRRAASRGEAQPPPAAPSRPAVSETEPARERRDFDSVATSVQEHIGRRTFEQREQRLAEEVAQADEEMEQHLQQAFSHRVGTLETSATVGAVPSASEVTPAPASDERATLTRAVAGLAITPQDLRRAILLKEILERPVDRW